MKHGIKASLKAIIVASLTISFLNASQIEYEFGEVKNFTDFSISGMSESKTKPIFIDELSREQTSLEKYLPEGTTLKIKFIDIDMAGDIQEWRNPTNSDIRYIEDIYIPKMKISYKLMKEDKILSEGEKSIKDINFLFGANPIKAKSLNFYYEIKLLQDFLRVIKNELNLK